MKLYFSVAAHHTNDHLLLLLLHTHTRIPSACTTSIYKYSYTDTECLRGLNKTNHKALCHSHTVS